MGNAGNMLQFLTVAFSGLSFVALAADPFPRKPLFGLFLACTAFTSLSSLIFG
jgi:hypothetical protein